MFVFETGDAKFGVVVVFTMLVVLSGKCWRLILELAVDFKPVLICPSSLVNPLPPPINIFRSDAVNPPFGVAMICGCCVAVWSDVSTNGVRFDVGAFKVTVVVVVLVVFVVVFSDKRSLPSELDAFFS